MESLSKINHVLDRKQINKYNKEVILFILSYCNSMRHKINSKQPLVITEAHGDQETHYQIRKEEKIFPEFNENENTTKLLRNSRGSSQREI